MSRRCAARRRSRPSASGRRPAAPSRTDSIPTLPPRRTPDAGPVCFNRPGPCPAAPWRRSFGGPRAQKRGPAHRSCGQLGLARPGPRRHTGSVCSHGPDRYAHLRRGAHSGRAEFLRGTPAPTAASPRTSFEERLGTRLFSAHDDGRRGGKHRRAPCVARAPPGARSSPRLRPYRGASRRHDGGLAAAGAAGAMCRPRGPGRLRPAESSGWAASCSRRCAACLLAIVFAAVASERRDPAFGLDGDRASRRSGWRLSSASPAASSTASSAAGRGPRDGRARAAAAHPFCDRLTPGRQSSPSAVIEALVPRARAPCGRRSSLDRLRKLSCRESRIDAVSRSIARAT
jgi:hypothetical protein